ncbi:MAG: hypothetical protein MK214_15710 [Thalassotalea sp.]|nr:hypothetical protein [Thalassotalea sp.]
MFKYNVKTLAQLNKHIKHKFPSDDVIVKSVGYNTWRRKLRGEVIKNTNGFKLFSAVLGQSAKLLNHPFWTLLATRKYDAMVIDGLMKRLPYKIRGIIRSSNRRTKSFPLKQSYASQKQCLFEEGTLDSLTALLLITITEIKRYKKDRCNQAEQLAFTLFFQLFTHQYPINDRDGLAIEVDKLLCHVANEFHVPFVEYEKDEAVEVAKSINPIFFGTLYTKNIANGMFKIVETRSEMFT